MKSSTLITIVAVWVLVFAALLSNSAAQTVQVTPMGKWSAPLMGAVGGIAVSGNYAYLASGLQVIDISNPANPVRVGSGSTGGWSLVVSGNYAYLLNSAGLNVIDISSPTNPVRVGGTNVSGSAQRVAISGNYAYVAANDYGLRVINISNPANPMLVGGSGYTGDAALSVAVSGNYAYVGVGFSLWVFDVSNPATPVLVGSTNVSGSPGSVVISGSYAYVGAGSVLRVIDISNPANPVQVGSATMSDSTGSVALVGNYAYVAVNIDGLEVFDISNPVNPVSLGVVSRNAYSVAVSGDYAYVGSYSGMRVIDISNPANPVAVGGFGTGGSTFNVALSGRYAYLANSSSGLEVIDINNVAAPVRVGGYYSSGYAQDVAVSGNYAYVADYYDGLQVINISNPAAPVRVGGYVTSSTAYGVAVSGNYAYVARDNDFTVRMDVIDVSTPSDPVPVGTYSITNPSGAWENHAGGIAVSGNYVYLSYGGWRPLIEFGDATFGGLEKIDVSNPAAPFRAGGYSTYNSTYAQYFGLALSGNYAYVAYGSSVATGPNTSSTSGGLQVLSLGPSYVGSYSTNTSIWPSDVAVSGNYAYLVGGSPRFQVINVSNPANPVRVGTYETSGSAVGVTASGDYAYVADGYAGLQILCINCPSLSAQLLGNSLVLRWPTYATTYVLQNSASLSAPNWQTVSGTPQAQGGFYLLSVPASNPAAFFRLRRP